MVYGTLTMTPFAAFWVQIVGIETFRFFQILEELSYVIDFLAIDRFASYVTQIGEFQM